MDRSSALSLMGSLSERLVTLIRKAHSDYRDGVPVDHQATLDSTVRARYVHNRISYWALIEFGITGAVCTKKIDSLQFLLIDRDPQGIALRWKKGDRYTCKSCNHDSGRQDSLQNEGELMFGGMSPLAHLFVVYTENEDDPLAPELERIALTCELRDRVEWQQMLWVAEAAPAPIQIETGFEQLQLPVQFKVKAKPTQAASGAEGEPVSTQMKKAE